MPLIPLKNRLTPEIIQNQDVDAVLTPEVWVDLESAYPSRFRELLLRDGKNPAFPDYKENIKDNPLLQRVIHDMFREFLP